MTNREKKFYESRVQAHDDSYELSSVWGPVIGNFLKEKYRQTRIIGSDNFITLNPKTVYVCGAYMDMGKNNYLVLHNDKTYFHETHVSIRREPLPPMTRSSKNTNMRVREADVFKYWQRDSPELLAKTYD